MKDDIERIVIASENIRTGPFFIQQECNKTCPRCSYNISMYAGVDFDGGRYFECCRCDYEWSEL